MGKTLCVPWQAVQEVSWPAGVGVAARRGWKRCFAPISPWQLTQWTGVIGFLWGILSALKPSWQSTQLSELCVDLARTEASVKSETCRPLLSAVKVSSLWHSRQLVLELAAWASAPCRKEPAKPSRRNGRHQPRGRPTKNGAAPLFRDSTVGSLASNDFQTLFLHFIMSSYVRWSEA